MRVSTLPMTCVYTRQQSHADVAEIPLSSWGVIADESIFRPEQAWSEELWLGAGNGTEVRHGRSARLRATK